MKVHRKHVRAWGKCRQGTKALCESYGLSWDELCTTGIDADKILATGDYRAAAFIEQVRKWEVQTEKSR